MARFQDVIQQGARADQPLATDVAVGTLYGITDEGDIIERSDGSAWSSYSPVAASVALRAATVTTSETQVASAAYGDLATPGPAVTIVTSSTTAIVWFSAHTHRNGGSGTGGTSFVSVAVSGASTVAASDTNSALSLNINNSDNMAGRVLYLTGLTAGSNTFTLKYHNDGGGSGTSWAFSNRSVAVFAP